jgi:hypothetical protein
MALIPTVGYDGASLRLGRKRAFLCRKKRNATGTDGTIRDVNFGSGNSRKKFAAFHQIFFTGYAIPDLAGRRTG